MPVDISGLDAGLPEAVRHFWRTRLESARQQQARGVVDQGSRGAVTAGKNMDGFVDLTRRLIVDNGLEDEDIHFASSNDRKAPGFFRPTKEWDLAVIADGKLVGVVECKSQVGSFGNNFNNRVEEAIGSAVDLRTAAREGVFGDAPMPFLGYLFVLQDCEASRRPVRITSSHFSAMDEFSNSGYARRYDILCRKLVREGLYDAAALILTDEAALESGECRAMSEETSIRRFAAALAGRIAGFAASRNG